jgi:tRNA(Arg) A34 adenosine deaminase TadA
VWSTRPADPFGAGLVKVHGKRWYQVDPREHGLDAPPLVEVAWRFTPTPVEAPSPDALTLDDPAGALAAAARLLATAPRDEAGASARPRWARPREVAALLVGRDGAVLGAARNTHGHNRTLHAEVNLVLAHVARTGGPLPTGSALFVTLRPCRACAGLIWAAAAEPASLRVIFADDDPGPGARNTVLCHGSDARARFARTPEERAARCLEQRAPAGRGPARGLAPPG